MRAATIALTLLATPTGAADGPARSCRVLAEYAVALTIHRDAGFRMEDAIAALRTTFASDPRDVPDDRIAGIIARVAWTVPRPSAKALGEAVQAGCLANPPRE